MTSNLKAHFIIMHGNMVVMVFMAMMIYCQVMTRLARFSLFFHLVRMFEQVLDIFMVNVAKICILHPKKKKKKIRNLTA